MKLTEEQKEYRKQYYRKNKHKWRKYWSDAHKRKTYIGLVDGKAKYSYEKKHPDWGNKPEGYRQQWISEWKKRNRLKTRIYRHNYRARVGKMKVKTIQRLYEENIKHYGTLTFVYCVKPIEFGKILLNIKSLYAKGGHMLMKTSP